MIGTNLAITMWLLVAGADQGANSIEKSSELGPVSVMVRLTPSEPVIGDSLTLQIDVIADREVELLMPEFGEALDRFGILEFVPRESVDDSGRTVSSQTYRLQPPGSGQQTIPPILIEFVDRRPGKRSAPDGYDAFEILTEQLEFTVKSVIPKDTQAELKPPLGRLSPRSIAHESRWPWVIAVFTGLVVAVSVAFWAGLRWRRRARRRSAYEIARARLDHLLAATPPTATEIDVFFVKLSGIVRRYLEDRFELRAPELTTEEFLESVSDSYVLSADHQQLLREFLRQSDLVKFAGFVPTSNDVESSIHAARRFLEETRENAPMISLDQQEGEVVNHV